MTIPNYKVKQYLRDNFIRDLKLLRQGYNAVDKAYSQRDFVLLQKRIAFTCRCKEALCARYITKAECDNLEGWITNVNESEPIGKELPICLKKSNQSLQR